MNKKIIFIVSIFLIILISSVSIYTIVNRKENSSIQNDYAFELNSNNKYEIITDMRWETMRDDGGSHTNIYYQVDLENKIVSKIKEDYEANLGGEPSIEKNTIYAKIINNNIAKEVKLVLDEAIMKQDIKEPNDYNFFTILRLNYEKDIFNTNTIEKIKTILNKIDEL